MLISCLETAAASDFSLDNLPLGVFSHAPLAAAPRACTRLGDVVVDLALLEEAGLFADVPGLAAGVLARPTLNALLAHPRPVWTALRRRLRELLAGDALHGDALHGDARLQEAAFHLASEVRLHLPLEVGDYTDFYASREHATNVGTMFRGKDHALQPNWLHLPVGYHGRASTVVVSGTPVRRPRGQLQRDPANPDRGSVLGPSRRLDFELEVAAVVGGPANPLGQPLTLAEARDRIFGFMLMNDWSARDIQKWEYVPLGPFTSKNFATSVAPWIVMAEALEGFTAPAPEGTPTEVAPLEYLRDPDPTVYDVELTVALQTKDQGAPTVVCRSNLRHLHWSAAQQLAHHAVTGCAMRPGDLLGSGTISGPRPDAYGSLLELSWTGTRDVAVGTETRKFLEDGDTVVMTARCAKPGRGPIGFGECSGTILPAAEESDLPKAEAAAPSERYRNLKLYSYWRSSCSWRVRTALAAKGISFETVAVDITKGEHKTVDYLAKNPIGQVPCLEYEDTVTGTTDYLSQSVAIIEFLDKAFPTRRQMFPSDASDRAAAVEMIEVINAGTQPLQNIFLLRTLEAKSAGHISAEDEAKRAIDYGLLALETLVKRRLEVTKGPFCLGSFSPTVVDTFMVPQVYNARRFGVDVDRICPTLVEIEQRCLQHPWFSQSHPAAQPDAPEE